MRALIEKGTAGPPLDGQPVYSIIIDEETDTDVNFMSLVQIDGTLGDLEEEFEISETLVKKLNQLPMFASIEVDLKIALDSAED